MKKLLILLSIFYITFGNLFFPGALFAGEDNAKVVPNPNKKKVDTIFKKNCTSCHGGLNPSQELNLETDKLLVSTINTASTQKKDFRLIDTANPQNSYLIMKIKNEGDIIGEPMPLKRESLTEGEIKIIEDWIWSMREGPVEKGSQISTSTSKPGRNPFWGPRLINLPTPMIVAKRHLLFRISHQFIPPFNEGYDAFYGLDGPAVVFFSLGYGISPKLNITLGRSNLFQEWELMMKWQILSPPANSSFPLFFAIHIGGNWATQTSQWKSVFASENLKFNLQLSFAYPLSSKISLLLVPGYSSNINHYDFSTKGAFVLGTGIKMILGRNLSAIGEWLPGLYGTKKNYGWGVGLEYKTGKHLFQLLATNSMGLTIDQFMGFGDLLLKKGDFRLGFTIFREF